jgi:hypothetical protein
LRADHREGERLAAVEPDAQDDDRSDATEPVGDPGRSAANEVRAAAAELANLAERPLDEHVAVYERLHARMQTALRSVAE